MEDYFPTFERGHQPHENRFIKVPGAESPAGRMPGRLRHHTGVLLLTFVTGGGAGALLHALLHVH